MKAVIQRVSSASVTIAGEVKSNIDNGLLILLCVAQADDNEDRDWLIRKIVNMRIFPDSENRMNQSVMDQNGDIIVVSQFTLLASTKKGNRPSFIGAAAPDEANVKYEDFVTELEKVLGKKVGTGEFGADMKVALVNDGPVTILLDSKNRV